ncbi:MAG: nuclease [Watsoniomyces obsoletus]|nr:MAG: nuclease [Watsoniomyces obsoletus]
MSKAALALVAAAGAATGAVATAAFYASRSERRRLSPTPTAASSKTDISPSRTAPSPPIPSQPTRPLRDLIAPVDPSGIFQYGFPGPINDLATRSALVSSFDRRLRNPSWVAEHITPESLSQHGGDRKHSYFTEDAAVPEKFRAKLHDYYRSGYDRGHQVPAADAKWNQQAMDETFYLTNMCPQVGDGFNRDYWAHLEDFCRRLTHHFPSVRIVTGPLYLPRRDPVDGKWRVSYEVIGNPPNVAVPTHFFKVIMGEDGKNGGLVALGAFVLPNAEIANDKPLTDFEVPLEAVERASGLEFAQELPAHRRRRLCSEVQCSLLVRDWTDRQKAFQQPQPQPQPQPSRQIESRRS